MQVLEAQGAVWGLLEGLPAGPACVTRMPARSPPDKLTSSQEGELWKEQHTFGISVLFSAHSESSQPSTHLELPKSPRPGVPGPRNPPLELAWL